MSFAESVTNLFALLSLYIRLYLLRLQHFLIRRVLLPTAPGRSRGAVRTVLLLGDGTAEGIGDTPGQTGLAGSLSKELRALLRDGKLRLLWRAVSCGRFGTAASDWGPGSALAAGALRAVPDADVVVLLLGMGDDLSAGKDAPAVRAVVDAAVALARTGRQVLLPRLPDLSDRGSGRAAAIAANEEIERLVAEADCYGGRVECAADIGKASAVGMDALRKEGDTFTFNPRGYRMLCGELGDEVAKAARRVEWKVWKTRIQG